ncbi:hypothetical protein IPC325_33225 [Pseudomonas aeruginosa]|nr:hypothetical protein IPC325_33225 [Pseudomonas aeruginosa]
MGGQLLFQQNRPLAACHQRPLPPFGIDRVGGGLTAAVLPHHRAYGSVHGGSGHAVKPIDRIQYRDQSKSVP